ncbi:FAD binding domain-containing protein [Cupriavidus basilensis]
MATASNPVNAATTLSGIAQRGEDELPNLLTDGTGKYWANGIPPGVIRPDVLADMEGAATDFLAPQFAEIVAKTAQPYFSRSSI